MEARVARLESDAEHIKLDVAAIKADVRSALTYTGTLEAGVAVLRAELNHKPSKGFIVATVSGGVVLMVAIMSFLECIQV